MMYGVPWRPVKNLTLISRVLGLGLVTQVLGLGLEAQVLVNITARPIFVFGNMECMGALQHGLAGCQLILSKISNIGATRCQISSQKMHQIRFLLLSRGSEGEGEGKVKERERKRWKEGYRPPKNFCVAPLWWDRSLCGQENLASDEISARQPWYGAPYTFRTAFL